MDKFKAYRIFEENGKSKGRLVEMTLDELQALDFGADGAPASVLTLSELISLVLDWRSRPTKSTMPFLNTDRVQPSKIMTAADDA